MMSEIPLYETENFGILSDDKLYLDCSLIKPPGLADKHISGIHVWVPKFPLTQATVLTCARQHVLSMGENGQHVSLIFDLRGTGNSDFLDLDFNKDLVAIRQWANERFGPHLPIRFYGTPDLETARVDLVPLQPGVPMELYVFAAIGLPTDQNILYLSSYGKFSTSDEYFCHQLAKAGYNVYALDPLRYLLHASANGRLTTEELAADFEILCQDFVRTPLLIGQSGAAGLALLWAAESKKSIGVITVGRAQAGLSPKHIFANDNPTTFHLSRIVNKISPSPVAFVVDGTCRQKDIQEINSLYQMSKDPRHLEKTDQVRVELLLKLIQWINEV